MIKKGFTLIELLIIVVIISILVGVALPYAQRYIDDSRMSKARQGMNEIRNALMRYESDQRRLYPQDDISDLVGPYLTRAIADPWGSPYRIDSIESRIVSAGPDRQLDTGDDIVTYFRPPLAITRAYWEDTNNNLRVDDGDHLVLQFTRPFATDPDEIEPDFFEFSSGEPEEFTAAALSKDLKTLRLRLQFEDGEPIFQSGNDYISGGEIEDSQILDYDGVPCRSQEIIIRSSR